MKSALVFAALALTAQAINNKASGMLNTDAEPSEHDLYHGLYAVNDWDGYVKSRPRTNDCSVRESENWLGSGMCKYSWECRGARMCEGTGFCLGNDACEEVAGTMPKPAPRSGAR